MTYGEEYLFLFEACKQAHSGLCNCLHNKEEGQKGESDGKVIYSPFLNLNADVLSGFQLADIGDYAFHGLVKHCSLFVI